MRDSVIDNTPEHKYKKHPRISLRDYFAAAALQGMLASGHQAALEQLTVLQGGKPADGLALAAYGFADAMLKARGHER